MRDIADVLGCRFEVCCNVDFLDLVSEGGGREVAIEVCVQRRGS